MILSGDSILLGTFGLYKLMYCLILTTLSSLTLNSSAALRCRCRLSGCSFQFMGAFLQKTAGPQKRGARSNCCICYYC